MKISHIASAAAAAMIFSSSAFAVDCSPNFPDNGQSPSFSDLTGVTVTQCAGFYGGNALNSGNAAALTLVNSVLTGWGMTAVAAWDVKYDTSNGLIDFGKTLYGDTVVAFHWGNFPGGDAGNVSAMYRFDAGAGVTSFNVVSTQGLSNAAVWVTGDEPIPGPIPEPSTYALMLAGLGAVGLVARRRRSPK